MVCVAGKNVTPGSCGNLPTNMWGLKRNESYAWSTASATRTALYLYRLPGNQTVVARAFDFSAADRVSATPVAWVSNTSPQPGAWPLKLWSSTRAAASASSGPLAATNAPVSATRWRVSGGPGSNQEIESAQDSKGPLWTLNATLGWALPLPTACYWGLPSVSFDDPAFGSPGKFVYWYAPFATTQSCNPWPHVHVFEGRVFH